jgi:hypothetical protein
MVSSLFGDAMCDSERFSVDYEYAQVMSDRCEVTGPNEAEIKQAFTQWLVMVNSKEIEQLLETENDAYKRIIYYMAAH